jgi:4-aminobutyrate aminotransferase
LDKLLPLGIKTKEILKKVAMLEAPSGGAAMEIYSDWPVIWAEGKGAEITDVEGNKYIDLTGGFSVANIGYCHPAVIEAITKQVKKLTHCRSRSINLSRVELLEILAKIVPGENKKIHFATGGTEAVEIALKLVELYTNKHGVISFYGSWHGRTYASLSISSLKEAKHGIRQLLPEVTFVPYAYCYRCPMKLEYPSCSLACISLIENLLEDPMTGSANIVAMIVEPIQGYGGHIVPPVDFIRELRRICDEYNIILITDEIYTGFGRAGKMFAVEHFNIMPDIQIVGKGLTGCLPLSAVIGNSEIMDAGYGRYHSMTFQANPISCAVAIANLKVIQESNLVQASAEKGEYFMRRLRELSETYEIIGDIRGKGLMIGIELVDNRRTKKPAFKKTKDLILSACRLGLLVDVAGRKNVVRLTPPLVITKEQIDKAVEIFEVCFRKLKSNSAN